ncbi:MAG: hypothetical protein ABR585_05215 [Gemmatimonadaceae bacterium]
MLSELPRSFNPPPAPPLDEMWTVIEDAHFNAPQSISRSSRFSAPGPWLAAAATLLLGIGIGHYLPPAAATIDAIGPAPVAAASTATASTDTSAMADAYRDQTSRYLGQTAALLISLPVKSGSTRADAAFAGKAADLLVTTRLLMDSPAASDPKLRALLDDLELVLVQIARLRGERNKSDLDLIHQTVEQGDVLSRLNSAVVTTQSAE